MKKYIIALLLLPLCAITTQAYAGKEHAYKDVTTHEFVSLRESMDDLVIVDSRGNQHFDNEVIEGAVHLSAKDTTPEALEKIIPEKNTPVVFYCSGVECAASGFSAYKAVYAGYTNVYKYPGGLDEWKKENLPTIALEK